MSINYKVIIEQFAEKHFIKTFAKKYKKGWDFTLSALIREFQNFDVILAKSIAEEITDRKVEVVICKTEFKISGTQDSRHGSGNRCILAVHKDVYKIYVLLVYNKNDLGRDNETVRWKQLIKENYPRYTSLL